MGDWVMELASSLHINLAHYQSIHRTAFTSQHSKVPPRHFWQPTITAYGYIAWADFHCLIRRAKLGLPLTNFIAEFELSATSAERVLDSE
jgi:hypothetical protein